MVLNLITQNSIFMKTFGLVINLTSKIFFRKKIDLFKIKLKNKYSLFLMEKENIDQEAIDMLIMAEDHRFFMHSGVDIIAIIRAIIKTYLFKKVEGGSTIEQQLVRTITGKYQRTIKRKFEEIILSCAVKEVVSKIQIPKLYLSMAYYGQGLIGYEKTKKHLLNKPNIHDNVNAILISMLKYPKPSKINLNREAQIKKRSEHIMKKYYSKKYASKKMEHSFE